MKKIKVYYPPFPKQPKQVWPGAQHKMNPVPDCGEETYIGTNQLKGKNALITGGDSGIGRAVAIAFSREGANVVINHLKEEEQDANDVIKLLSYEGAFIKSVPIDIRRESNCKLLVDKAASIFKGRIDILVCCAGYMSSAEHILDLTTKQFDDVFKTNIYSSFWIIKNCLQKYMPKGSNIILTASGTARVPVDFLLDYSASKAAVVGFTKSLAKQLAKDFIRVNSVSPGPFWTVFSSATGSQSGHQDSLTENMGSTVPMGRPGQPAEIAPIYVLLASDKSSFTSGQDWVCGGGNDN